MIEAQLQDGPYHGQVHRLPSATDQLRIEVSPQTGPRSWTLHLVVYRNTGRVVDQARWLYEYEGTE